MRPSEIHRAVARATGESRRTIARRGFSLDNLPPECQGDLPIGVDCPGCGHQLLLSPFGDDPHEIECPHCDAVYDIHPDELRVVEATILV